MKMNYVLAKELYGITPWFVDQHSLPSMMALLNGFRNGIELDLPDNKHNSVLFYNLNQDSRVVDRPYGDYWEPGQLENNDKFEAIAVVNIDGPITKGGGASSYGMVQVSNLMKKINSDERVIGFILYSDSGGGSSGAVNIMRDTIREIKKTKPVFGLIQKGGYACSAMYGILAACTKIYAEDPMNVVGSVGTMIEFVGKAANTEYKDDGQKHIRLYATKSTKKNLAFEEALNNDNFELLRSEILDPVNEGFINEVQSDRPALKGTDFDDGHTVYAKDSVGVFVDGIKSFEQTVKDVKLEAKTMKKEVIETDKKTNKNSSKINNTMDINELKSLHPQTYNAIFNAGVAAEKDRVGVWMAHFETDPDKVKEGIKSGNDITGAEREELIVKAQSKTKLDVISNDSPPNVTTQESNDNPGAEDEKEAADFYKDM